MDEVDPLFAQATVAQSSEFRRRRRHHRSRRRQRRKWLLAGIGVAVVVIAAVGAALVLRHGSSTPAATGGFFPRTAAQAGAAAAAATPGTWTYKDLAGQPVIVKQTNAGTTRFVTTATGLIPLAVAGIDKDFTTKGCEGGQAAFQQWNPVTPSAKAVPRYSAFARYTVDKGKVMNCAWATAIPTP